MENQKIVIERTGKNDIDFDGISWAIRARSSNKDRENINIINISSGVVVGTNGHVLHAYTTIRDIPEGSYSVLSDTKKMIVLEKSELDFPDYERVFPQHTYNGIKPFYGSALYYGKVSYTSRILNHVLKQSKSFFNTDYLSTACPEGEDLIFRQAEDPKGPLVIRNEDYSKAALVMPYLGGFE